VDTYTSRVVYAGPVAYYIARIADAVNSILQGCRKLFSRRAADADVTQPNAPEDLACRSVPNVIIIGNSIAVGNQNRAGEPVQNGSPVGLGKPTLDPMHNHSTL
jgi:hypothetical protein